MHVLYEYVIFSVWETSEKNAFAYILMQFKSRLEIFWNLRKSINLNVVASATSDMIRHALTLCCMSSFLRQFKRDILR